METIFARTAFRKCLGGVGRNSFHKLLGGAAGVGVSPSWDNLRTADDQQAALGKYPQIAGLCFPGRNKFALQGGRGHGL